MNSEDETIISVEGLWKRYGVENPKIINKIDQTISRLIRKQQKDTIWALKDISFEIKKGETFGIIGRNGAGKSTLLKILSGVTPPSRGSVNIMGSIFPMIELNAGMHIDFTGRENVRLLGTLMGLTADRIESLMCSIEDFCELDDWFDRPVRQYSSGMIARLGFSVGVNVNADILIIDEVLSVGDFQFQKKCFDQMEKIKKSGATILFVSHNSRMIERICSRALYLKDGYVSAIGNSSEVIEKYMHDSLNEISTKYIRDDLNIGTNTGTGEIIVTNITIINDNQETTKEIIFGEKFTIKIDYYANKMIIDPIFFVGIHTPDVIVISYVSNINDKKGRKINKYGSITCTFTDFKLNPGIYGIKVGISLWDGRIVYKKDSVSFFKIIPNKENTLENPGFIVPNFKWDYCD